MPDSLHFLSAQALHEHYGRNELSPTDVLEALLERAERLDKNLNAFVALNTHEVRQQAQASEERWRRSEPLSKLDGIPVSIKDLVAMKGFATRCGSRTTDPDAISEVDSPMVARLREAGAVLLGKTHTSEFGWKGITDSPMFGITRNPWNPDHSPGGSSGGAGAAVAAGIGPLAHGSDGGGSIRIPASYCGLYGIKPTFGRVPQTPNDSPYATLTSNGPLAHTVRDAARMLTILARPDSRDWYSAPYQAIDFEDGLESGVEGLRIAYSPRLGGVQPAPEIEAMVSNAVQRFEAMGATVETVDTVFDPLRPTFEDYWKASFAYLMNNIREDRRDLLDPGLHTLAIEGRDVDLNAYYQAVSARARLGSHMEQFHQDFDLLVTPTMPTTAPRADTIYHSPEFDRWDHAVPYTVPFNLTGQPAASIPIGLADNGLPVGMQIVGPRYAEASILRASHAFEAANPFNQHPNTE